MQLSPQEEYLLNTLRDPVPYEMVIITKDKDGKPGRFHVVKTQTIVVTEMTINAVQSTYPQKKITDRFA